jgi:predicted enzyme related to lactoylglutathione lyase
MRFQRVPEPRSSKVRIHLDILVDDLQVAIERVEELGAKQAVDGYYSEFRCTWQVMLDPEGNEFCLVFKED